jgi:hypothetical protein
MPKYRNTNGFDVAIASTRIPANGSIEATEVLENYGALPAGVTNIATTPLANPIVDSGTKALVLPGQWTLSVPAVSSNLSISVFCMAGSVDVYLQSMSNTPPTVLPGGGFSTNFIIRYGTVNQLIIDFKVANAKISYEIRKIA